MTAVVSCNDIVIVSSTIANDHMHAFEDINYHECCTLFVL